MNQFHPMSLLISSLVLLAVAGPRPSLQALQPLAQQHREQQQQQQAQTLQQTHLQQTHQQQTQQQSNEQYEQVNQVNMLTEHCHRDSVSFELVTGYVFTSPEDTLSTLPVILKLTDCLNYCRRNSSCKAVNFETGYCILLSSSASEKPGLLSASQFPVFTIYAEKVCLKGLKERLCPRSWSFEKVIGYELRGQERRRIQSVTRERCLEACLQANDFECRSLNYNNVTGECTLSHLDRHALPATQLKAQFAPASASNVDYYESNCVQEPKVLCDFKAIKGKVLKTVDSVHQEISSADECKEICLNSAYRCFSYDFGDPSDGRKVCRTSHLDSASLTHIEEPYVQLPDAITYQRQSCYNVSIVCKAKEMIATIQTNKLFSGKIYAKSKPNSCVTDVTSALSFELSMPYHDLLCDVKQRDAGKFTNDIVIQHHDMVVTTKDLGLAVNCNYDLTNKSVSNINSLTVDGDLETREEEAIHSASVGAPNITMSITDRNGNPIKTAQVGDSLMLHVEIIDKNSPYQIFIRELVAVDGVDTSDIMLIDSQGCPTDINIMGFVSKSPSIAGQTQSATSGTGMQSTGRSLEIPFDAFKFPTSDTVQFRALVTPCLHACEPVFCVASNYDGRQLEQHSYGRRRRRSVSNSNHYDAGLSSHSPASSDVHRQANRDSFAPDEELVLVQSIKILDSLERERTGKQRKSIARIHDDLAALENALDDNQLARLQQTSTVTGCLNAAGLSVLFVLFLALQVLLLLSWAFCWMRRSISARSASSASSVGSLESYANRPSSVETAAYHGYVNNAYLTSHPPTTTANNFKSNTVKASNYLDRSMCYLNSVPSDCPSPTSFTKAQR